MQQVDEEIRFSASDLVGHLDCHHLTALDAAVARGSLNKPKIWDPVLQTLVERELAHERQHVERLKEPGVTLVDIAGGGTNATQVDQTLREMRSGADVVVQGSFLQGTDLKSGDRPMTIPNASPIAIGSRANRYRNGNGTLSTHWRNGTDRFETARRDMSTRLSRTEPAARYGSKTFAKAV